MQTKEQKIAEILQKIDQELSGAIGSAVFTVSTGLSVAAHAVRGSLDLSLAAAYNAEVIKQQYKALNAFGFSEQILDEFIITMSTQTHIIKTITRDIFLYVVLDTSTSNLGMAKIVIDKYLPTMREILS